MRRELLLLLLIYCISFRADAQKKGSSLSNFSAYFNKYDSTFDALVVHHPEGNFLLVQGLRFRVIGQKGKQCFVIDHFLRVGKEDSIVRKKVSSCKPIFTFIQKQNPFLQSEEMISTPCISKTLVPGIQDSLIEITSLQVNTDLVREVVEYKIAAEKRHVQQLDPRLAMTICPESPARRSFMDLIELIRNF